MAQGNPSILGRFFAGMRDGVSSSREFDGAVGAPVPAFAPERGPDRSSVAGCGAALPEPPSTPFHPGMLDRRGPAERDVVPPPASAKCSWRVGDSSLEYVASAGHLDVVDAQKALEGKMFNVSYVVTKKDGTPVDQRKRPVTFAFNGGPGSASVPINFGGIGPVRVKTNGVEAVSPVYEVEDNPGTILGFTDLVFLDGLGTGWSFVAEGYDATKVYGLEEDARTFCRAIMQWLEENDRWGSPLYIFGESYGTMRSAVLMRYLGEVCVPVTGVVMLSAYYDWTQNLPGTDLYYIGMLPSFAATAHFFGKAGEGRTEAEWFAEASTFAAAEFAAALLIGDAIEPARMEAVCRRVSEFIGLPYEYVLSCNGRIQLEEFRQRLLEDEGKVIGRLDMRFTEEPLLPLQRDSFFFACEDPAVHALDGQWNAAFRDFLRGTVGYRGPASYRNSVWREIGIGWNWVHDEPGVDNTAVAAPNLALDIAVALRRSPRTKMLIVGGRFDAATPWWNVRRTISALYLPPELRRCIDFKLYSCGHMCYVDEPTLHEMHADLEEFYNKVM